MGENGARKKRPVLVTAGGCAGICLILGVFLLATPVGFVLIPIRHGWNSSRNLSEYDRRKDYYDGIIRTIQKELAVAGQTASYEFPKDSTRLTRRPPVEPGTWPSRGRWIHAHRLPDGHLSVSFDTFNMGHAGVWFLLYFSGEESHDSIRGLYPAEPTRVAPHWWAVEDRSG